MSERFTNRCTWQELHDHYTPSTDLTPSDFHPRYNIAPMQSVPVVRLKQGARDLVMMRWGLVPSTEPDPNAAPKRINAPADRVADSKVFKSAFLRRRCLVPADGFYAWRKEGKSRLPYFITMKDKTPLAFAGVWEWWRPKDNSGEVLTFAIITTTANTVVAPVDDRMPVILSPELWPLWLAEKAVSPGQLQAMLKPYPPERMTSWPVANAVNKVENDGPALVEAIAS